MSGQRAYAIRTWVRDAANFRSPLQKIWIVSDGEKTMRGQPRESLPMLRFKWIDTFGEDPGDFNIVTGVKLPEEAEVLLGNLSRSLAGATA